MACKLDHGLTHGFSITRDHKGLGQNIAIVNADRNSMVLHRRTYVVGRKKNQVSENVL